jgi:hypothetical protein
MPWNRPECGIVDGGPRTGARGGPRSLPTCWHRGRWCARLFPLETELRSFYGGMAERCAEVAVKVGAISEFERRAWLDAFHERGAEGPIIAGRLHVFVWGRKD